MTFDEAVDVCPVTWELVRDNRLTFAVLEAGQNLFSEGVDEVIFVLFGSGFEGGGD